MQHAIGIINLNKMSICFAWIVVYCWLWKMSYKIVGKRLCAVAAVPNTSGFAEPLSVKEQDYRSRLIVSKLYLETMLRVGKIETTFEWRQY